MTRVRTQKRSKLERKLMEILSKFFFYSPSPKHCQVLTDIIGVLMATAAREDKEFKTKAKNKTIDNQTKSSITFVGLVHVVLAGRAKMSQHTYSRKTVHPSDSPC